MKSIYYLCFILLCQLLATNFGHAAVTITSYLDDDDDPIVYSIGLNPHRLVTDYSAGDSQSTAIKTYIPVDSVGDSERALANVMGEIVSQASGSLRFDLKIASNTDSSDRTLVGLFKLDDVWTVIYRGTVAGSTNYEPYGVQILATRFWNDISQFTGVVRDSYLYFFITSDTYADGDTIDESALPSGGLYYRTYFSGKLYTASQYTPTLASPQKGDGRAYLFFRSDLMPYAYHAAVVSYNSAQAIENNYAAASGAGTILKDDFSSCNGEDQEFTVSGLTNSQEYHLSVACIDKFQYATLFDQSVSVTPESIDAFLKKNACYLISAGFQREHYVLAYFRDFRDQVLAHSSWGKKFISWYYRTAPKYALYIVHHPFLSAVMRGIAYFLYFIFRFWNLLLIPVPFIIALLYYFLRGKRDANA